MIDFANESDFKDISLIWQLCFGDSLEYIKMFWNEVAKSHNIIVYRKNNKVVAMYFFLECETIIDGNRNKSYYLYAAATNPEYRKKGIMSKLIYQGFEIAKDRGIDYIILVPQDEYLYNYYLKFGFKTAFKKNVVEVDKDSINLVSNKISQIKTNSDMLNIRNKSLENINHLSWDKKILNYSKKEHLFTNGKFVQTPYAYAFYREEKDIVHVKEICSKSNYWDVIGEILKQTNANKYVFNLPSNQEIFSCDCKQLNVGMIKSLNNKNVDFEDGYIGLTLG